MFPRQVGRYELKAELGRGGMATVYRAYDPRFKREVAIKVLPREFLHDPRFLQRFTREAQTIAALEHPAIVPVHDFGEQDGQPYLVMRLMTGGSLADRLQHGPIPLLEAARIFSRLAPALDKAHSLGIVHRDLKPGNILFDADGDPYISDFGIAKLAEATASITGDRILGTPAYMSPEQARGEKDIDGRSDIYALGAIVFQMLTGRLPYEADTPMGLVVKHLTQPTPRILEARPDLPPACEDLIQKAMAKDRTQRFSSVNGLAEALATTAISARSVAISPERTERLRPPLRLRRWAWIGAGAIALAILAIGTVIWLGRGRERGMASGLGGTSISTASTLVSSATPTAQAPLPAVPPTVKPTSTTRSIPTPTPPPAWVTEFAEPILAAIAGREADFQDDFSTLAGGWKVSEWCANLGTRIRIENGEMTLSGLNCWVWPEVWYPDFVAEMDARFLPGAPTDSSWAFHYRHIRGGDDAASNFYQFRPDGGVSAGLVGPGDRVERTNLGIVARPAPASSHIVAIAKGQAFALYINDRPVFYKLGEPVWPNGGIRIDMASAEAIGDFKIWDISGILPPPTGTP